MRLKNEVYETGRALLARDVCKRKRGATPNIVTSRVSCDHGKGSAKALEKHTHDALAGVDVHINGCAGCILDVIDKERNG